MSARRNFSRPLGKKSYRRLFLIAVEGPKTETTYFEKLFTQHIIQIVCIKHRNRSSPLQVLKRLKQELEDRELIENDEAWIVVDKDK